MVADANDPCWPADNIAPVVGEVPAGPPFGSGGELAGREHCRLVRIPVDNYFRGTLLWKALIGHQAGSGAVCGRRRSEWSVQHDGH